MFYHPYSTAFSCRVKLEEAERIGIEKGRQEGIEKGIEEGIEKGIEKTALNLLKNGASIDLIARSTGLSAKEIKKLQ